MTNDEQQVRAVVLRLCGAIEDLANGKGLKTMRDVWHQSPLVTSAHPAGDWAEGWDEVWATWEVFASFGREGRGGSRVESVRVRVFGDFAYAATTFVAAPAFGGESLSFTNVFQRIDGEWKIIHHHADKSPKMAEALEKFAAEG